MTAINSSNIEQLINSLPDHWRVIKVGDHDDHGCDDGRDYRKPMFVRKDGLARIYFNKGEEGTDYCYAIAWDEDGGGDCCGDFQEAIQICDDYVARHHPNLYNNNNNT